MKTIPAPSAFTTVRGRRRVALATGLVLAAGTALAGPAAAAPAPAATATVPGVTHAQVVNARYATHCTYDRVVIDLAGGLYPGTTVRRVSKLVYDGSGKPVPLPGRYFLEVKLSPAAGHDEAGHSVYKGPKLKRLTLPKLKGIALTGDFEGVVTFGLAFTTSPKYSTAKLHHPDRFVVDVQHAKTC
ncbi:hypothetical protein [Streptomyces sp. NPDC089919]|uniref:AMIN-like domain-containing (lipo)protein n=1 Tax=Streptomyces sp. NPDC089919 TaxID=3155188 RepID=UPI00341D7F8D